MQIKPEEKKLFDIVVEEYKKTVEEQSLMLMDGLLDVHLAGIDFAGMVFVKNYSLIMQYHSVHFDLIKKYNLTQKEKYELVFNEVVNTTSTLIDMSYGSGLYKRHDQLPREFGLLSKWIYWCGIETPSEDPEKQNIAIINPEGERIIDEWNKFKSYRNLEED